MDKTFPKDCSSRVAVSQSFGGLLESFQSVALLHMCTYPVFLWRTEFKFEDYRCPVSIVVETQSKNRVFSESVYLSSTLSVFRYTNPFSNYEIFRNAAIKKI